MVCKPILVFGFGLDQAERLTLITTLMRTDFQFGVLCIVVFQVSNKRKTKCAHIHIITQHHRATSRPGMKPICGPLGGHGRHGYQHGGRRGG